MSLISRHTSTALSIGQEHPSAEELARHDLRLSLFGRGF